jgi:ketosteroid isomerase-like protein
VNYSSKKTVIYPNNVTKQSFSSQIFHGALKVSHASSYIPDGTIESASSFFVGSSRSSAPCHASRTLSNQQQSAMARRLEQLQAALGDGETAPIAPGKPTAAATRTVQQYTSGQLFITGLLAAMLGAGTMWLTQNHQNRLDETPQASIQAVVTPAPLPATTLLTPAPETKISDEQTVAGHIEAWRRAWQARDVAGYLAAYSASFMPSDGTSRDAWQTARQKKLASGGTIEIRINDQQIERIDAQQFKVSFLQDYTSGTYRETGRRKSLLMTQDGREWKITREWQE